MSELNLLFHNPNLEALADAHNKLVRQLSKKIKELEDRIAMLESKADNQDNHDL